MQLKVFYSWQSDLPNRTNRGLIGESLEVALKRVYERNSNISEQLIDMAGRNESGTPDLVTSIFSKIDQCDVFVADVSIINSEGGRKTPNPNVLIELGYASSVLGWDRIICVFNQNHGAVEDLPFDIRFRKPIQYKVDNEIPAVRKQLSSAFVDALETILNLRLSDKRFYASAKRTIDLALQAILIDVAKILYSEHPENIRKYDYQRILHIGDDELVKELSELEVLGFKLFKDQRQSIIEFRDFFNDGSRMHFFNDRETNVLARLIAQLDVVERILSKHDNFVAVRNDSRYKVARGKDYYEGNPNDGYILLETQTSTTDVVLDRGSFRAKYTDKLTCRFKVAPESVKTLSAVILDFSAEVRSWIQETGGVFIFNHRLLEKSSEPV